MDPLPGHCLRRTPVQIPLSLLFLELSGYYVNAVRLHGYAADVLVRHGVDREGSRYPPICATVGWGQSPRRRSIIGILCVNRGRAESKIPPFQDNVRPDFGYTPACVNGESGSDVGRGRTQGIGSRTAVTLARDSVQ